MEEGDRSEGDHQEEQHSTADPKIKPLSGSLRCAQVGDDGGESKESTGSTRSMSFSRLFSFRIATTMPCSSLLQALDIGHDPAADAASSESSSANDDTTATKKKTKKASMDICRSQSLPMSTRPRFSSKGGFNNRVADSSSFRLPPGGSARFRVSVIPPVDGDAESNAAAEEVAEEEALVCRICMVALSEEAGSGGTLKLECRCKGELALAHGDCAVKWFSIKGNGTCDVCNHEVLNLPVTLRRVHEQQQQQQLILIQQEENAAIDDPNNTAGTGGGYYSYGRVWRGTPILAIVSMLAYFCFLEQLLVGDHGTAALAISMPFACVLGLFSSLTVTKMVSRRYVWIYSAVQYLFIVLFTHLFYRYVRSKQSFQVLNF
ncbi:hypothetical protein GUJ93_ZPchr0012g22050 [Zizania palustris]|uniref:RING-CH-type domain-containing protein n=1 Tax=Zizania palustris TaxID=103762 RepID=A0A8J5WQN5_ZIZPA|nr:hypothetical protein GUJ93_ZPchr0012g22050 [Zizania palustris]